MDWAKATGQDALQAETAQVVSWQIHIRDSKKRLAKWDTDIMLLASQAKEDGRWKDYEDVPSIKLARR